MAEDNEDLLLYTPTYIIALVALIFLALSLAVERGIHVLGAGFKRRKKKPLSKVLKKIKDELMLLGLASILISVFSVQVSSICGPVPYNNVFVFCPIEKEASKGASPAASETGLHGAHRRLLEAAAGQDERRLTVPAVKAASLPSLTAGHRLYGPDGQLPGESPLVHRRILRKFPLETPVQPGKSWHVEQSGAHGRQWPHSQLSRETDTWPERRASSEGLEWPPPTQQRRSLSGGETLNTCPQGQVPLVPSSTLHEVHLWIFCLAVVHILFSCLTMLLATTKMWLWKRWGWEQLAQDIGSGRATCDEITAGPKSQSYVSRHLRPVCKSRALSQRVREIFLGAPPASSHTDHNGVPTNARADACSLAAEGAKLAAESKADGRGPEEPQGMELPGMIALTLHCFFQQFTSPVRSDYLTLRASFITSHRKSRTYNFHEYLVRSMEHDFIHVVGTSWYLWLFACVLVLLNFWGSNILFYLSLIPLMLALCIGTKLEYVMAQLAYESYHMATGPCIGLVMRGRDGLFWLGHPKFLLELLHFMLFQNSYMLAGFLWSLWQFKTPFPCGRGPEWGIIARVVISICTQLLCGFVTLPLYALVAHMGSDPRMAAVLPEIVQRRLHSLARRHRTTGAQRALNAVSAAVEPGVKAAGAAFLSLPLGKKCEAANEQDLIAEADMDADRESKDYVDLSVSLKEDLDADMEAEAKGRAIAEDL